MHYHDGSHRRVGPPHVDTDLWADRIDEHVERHRQAPNAATFVPGAGRLAGTGAEPHAER
jgi:hypothetical protein